MKKFFAILAISFAFGVFVALVISLTDDANNMHEKLLGFGIFAFLMFLFQLDDFLVAVCMLVRCAELNKPEIKDYVAQASQKAFPWPLHLGSRMFNRKIVVYEGLQAAFACARKETPKYLCDTCYETNMVFYSGNIVIHS